MGFVGKNPRWAIALKFSAEKTITVIKKIDLQVGRTGAITPVANLEPVLISGSIVKRASLHSYDQMKKYKLRVDDSVFVEKGGEIIPKITGIAKTIPAATAINPTSVFPSRPKATLMMSAVNQA